MKKIILILLILFLSNASYSQVTIQTIKDDFDNTITYRMEGNLLERVKGRGGVFFNLQKLEKDMPELKKLKDYDKSIQNLFKKKLKDIGYIIQEGKVIKYSLIVVYDASNWIFIEDGESLILLVDGKRMGFEGDGSWNHRDIGGILGINERAWYDINLEQLRAIINAKEVRVKVVGSQYYVERIFSENNFKNFRDFYNQYVKVNKSEK